jgi:hypothetical protein
MDPYHVAYYAKTYYKRGGVKIKLKLKGPNSSN